MRCARTAERSGTLPETETHRMDTYAPDVKGEGYLHITERTADKLYEVGKKKLIPGKTVRIRRYAQNKEGGWILRQQRKGTILALYKYHFLVETANGKRECFRYNQMFGTEEVRVHP